MLAVEFLRKTHTLQFSESLEQVLDVLLGAFESHIPDDQLLGSLGGVGQSVTLALGLSGSFLVGPLGDADLEGVVLKEFALESLEGSLKGLLVLELHEAVALGEAFLVPDDLDALDLGTVRLVGQASDFLLGGREVEVLDKEDVLLVEVSGHLFDRESLRRVSTGHALGGPFQVDGMSLVGEQIQLLERVLCILGV